MNPIEPRSLHAEEVAILKAALERAPLGEPCAASRTSIENLKVVGTCQCGCDSLYFSGIGDSSDQFRIADGLGYTEDGEEIGIIVWASGDQIVHLDLYNYGEMPARLPKAESVCPFEGLRRMRQ
jgi:hypothetical protein